MLPAVEPKLELGVKLLGLLELLLAFINIGDIKRTFELIERLFALFELAFDGGGGGMSKAAAAAAGSVVYAVVAKLG